MPKQPVVSGRVAVEAFKKIGYQVVRQKGSHIRLRDVANEKHRPLTVPDHKALKAGLLRRLIHDADLTAAEFEKLLK